jgi:hypothetical protein
VEIVPFSSTLSPAVDRFNEKLAAAGSEWSFPAPERPPGAEDLRVWTESYVAMEKAEVFGGYILKHQKFFLNGNEIDVGSLQLPLSLGEINEEYGRVSVALLFDAIRRAPYLYSLGLGAEDTQFARLLTAAEWEHITVPFYFKVLSPNRFAREIQLPPGRARMEKALRVLGHARLAGAAFRLRGLRGGLRRGDAARQQGDGIAREVESFDGIADEIFSASAADYFLIGDRTAAALREIYPRNESRYLRLVVERERAPVGWTLVLDTQMQGAKYFGNLRVGSIADCLAQPSEASATVAAATVYLAARGVDLIVSNQLDRRWCSALEQAGYDRAPSNFFFYFSPDLAAQLTGNWQERTHVNRGDGEGPAHL